MRHLILFSCMLMCSVSGPILSAQNIWDGLASSSYRAEQDFESLGHYDADTIQTALAFELDNLSFFRDNEYSSTLTKGYSLPGLWLQPKLTYTTHRQIRLEAGFHALIFNGANKYPCYVYHDIGTWKGSQYQSGAHVLPWFRAQASFRRLTVVLGDIYGGQNHKLTEPLWNTETNLSQDPEMGAQLLWDLPHLHADTWVNWQSYIFKEASHQEAFTVGSTWQIRYNAEDSPVQWFTPVQLVIQHRGGEQDTTSMGVQTICNASLGGAVRWMAGQKALRTMDGEVNLLAAYQQSGHLWPFNTGMAIHAAAGVHLWEGVEARLGVFRAPRHFVSLYGNPFFGTLSQRDETAYRGITTAYARIGYCHVFSRHYILGTEAEAYQSWMPHHQEFNFSFGLYLRVNPRFIICK